MFSAVPAYHPAVPLHHQIHRVLRAKIESGEWATGEQVPTEHALVARFKVSRNTIREALRALERDGLIVRQRGRGTFVRPRTPAVPARSTITNLILGYESEIRVVRIETVAAPPQVSDFLALPRGTRVRKFVRAEIVDGGPLAIVLNYMPIGIGRRIRAADLARHSMLQFLRDRLDIQLGVLRHSIEARMPDDEVASRLGIDLIQPVLFVRLFVSDAKGRPVEVSDTYYRADRYRYEVEMPILPERRLRKGTGRPRGTPARPLVTRGGRS